MNEKKETPYKVVFYFSGTGENKSPVYEDKNSESKFPENVIRVYLSGCHKPETGGNTFLGGFINPDLEVTPNKIRSAFKGKEMSLETLRQQFGDEILIVPKGLNETDKVPITDISLNGFSRGGLISYNCAKKLDDLNIPIDVFANQPVPGEVDDPRVGNKKYKQCSDLSECKNLRSCTTVVGSYSLENHVLHNQFYKQMIPKFKEGQTYGDEKKAVEVKNILVPRENHMAKHMKKTPLLMNVNHLASHDYLGKFKKTLTDTNNQSIKDDYIKNRLAFTPKQQKILGEKEGKIIKDPLYEEAIKENANLILQKLNITDKDIFVKSESTTDEKQQTSDLEKAHAIRAIYRSTDHDLNSIESQKIPDEDAKKMIQLALSDTEEGEQFRKLVVHIGNTCDYLDMTSKGTGNLITMVKESIAFKTKVFTECYHLITGEEELTEERINTIYNAQKTFEKNATEYIDSIDEIESTRDLIRLLLSPISQFFNFLNINSHATNTLQTLHKDVVKEINDYKTRIKDIKQSNVTIENKNDATQEINNNKDNTQGMEQKNKQQKDVTIENEHDSQFQYR